MNSKVEIYFRIGFKKAPEGPTSTPRSRRADPNPKDQPLSSFFLHQHLYKNIVFVCNYLLLPQKADQPQAQDRRANPTGRANPNTKNEGPTPTRRANSTPREGTANPKPQPSRRKGQPRPEGPTPPRRANFNTVKEGRTPNSMFLL